MRILAITNMYPSPDDPAFGVFVASQMESIREAGHEVDIRVINGRKGGMLAYGRAIRRVRDLTRTGAYDLVHAHYGLTGYVASFGSLPFVVSYCGDDLLGTPDGRGGLTWKSRIVRRLSCSAARSAAGLICKSEGLRATLPRAVDRARARVIANGVDTRLFSPGSRRDARQALELPLEEYLVLFPHTPGERRKRLDLAEAAMARLDVLGVRARLWKVSGVRHEDMARCYQAADCMLLTSDWEGSPNTVKEASCCDLPVVSVDAGDAADWIRLARGSVLVARDPVAIADALRRVLTCRERADGTVVRRHLALPAVAARIIEVYREALHGPREERKILKRAAAT